MGLGPLQWAALTGSLMGHIETALSDETGGPTGHLIPLPEGQSATAELKGDITNLRGKVALPETVAGGYGDRGAAPARDWRPVRLGSDPPAGLVTLRDDVERAILSCCGIPPALAVGLTDGTMAREAYRQFLFLTIQPIARLVEATLQEVYARTCG